MQRNFDWERSEYITENGDKFLSYKHKHSDAKLDIQITHAGQLQSICYDTSSQVVADTCSCIKGCRRYKYAYGQDQLDCIRFDRKRNAEIDNLSVVKLMLDIINHATPLAEIKNEVYAILNLNNSKQNIVSAMSEKIESLQPKEQSSFKPSMFK